MSASRQGFENSCPPAKESAFFLQEVETIAKAVFQRKNPKSSLSGAVDGSDNRWESYCVCVTVETCSSLHGHNRPVVSDR